MKGANTGFSLRELRQHPEYLNAYVISEDRTTIYHEKTASGPVKDYCVKEGKVVEQNDQRSPVQWSFARASPMEYTHVSVRVNRQCLVNLLRTMEGDSITIVLRDDDDCPVLVRSDTGKKVQEAVIAPILKVEKEEDI